jgi:hypothetical protein
MNGMAHRLHGHDRHDHVLLYDWSLVQARDSPIRGRASHLRAAAELGFIP